MEFVERIEGCQRCTRSTLRHLGVNNQWAPVYFQWQWVLHYTPIVVLRHKPRLSREKDKRRLCLSLMRPWGLTACCISMLFLLFFFFFLCNGSTHQYLDVVFVWASEDSGPPPRPKAPNDSDSSAAGRLIARCGDEDQRDRCGRKQSCDELTPVLNGATQPLKIR